VDGCHVANAGGSVAADGAGELWIGGSPSVSEFFRGGVNEVRIYRRSLSAAEVSHLSEHPVGVARTGARAEENRPELFAHYRTLLVSRNLTIANLDHGAAVFAKSCGQCHTVRGEGGSAGPELRTDNLRDLEYLLPHVLDPDGVIDEPYRYYKFELKDERVVLGVIAEESRDSYTLESTAGRYELAKEAIARQDVLPYSLMPDAVFQTLTDEEVRDLVAYLQQ
jgi:putative heme-binding domain-containing protein